MSISQTKDIIVVGTNSLTESQYPAYTNHCQLWFRFGRQYPQYQFAFCNPSRMSIDRMRNMTAKVALEMEAKYILFIDDDVLVPFDGLKKLITLDADVAAGKVVIRGYPFDWMVFSPIDNEGVGGCNAYKELPEEGIMDVGAVGFSFCLIKTEVLKKMAAPYFVTGATWTEDIYFCLKAKQANPELTVKVDCSVDCGHILWPETMNSTNRTAYMKYMEEINPELKARAIKQEIDRSMDYLKQVEERVNVTA